MLERTTTFIYGLRDPRTDRIRYVGKSDWPEDRLWVHLQYAGTKYEPNPHKGRWLLQLKAANLEPELVILEECQESRWVEREQFWIAALRSLGEPLTNIAPGGNAPPIHWGPRPTEVGQKIAETHRARGIRPPSAKGRKRSEESRRRMSESGKRNWLKKKGLDNVT